MMSSSGSTREDYNSMPNEASVISKKMKAVIFINIYCIFDTLDNINAKTAMAKGVDFLDLTLARIFLNFISAIIFVTLAG